jgi:hypothetical protein
MLLWGSKTLSVLPQIWMAYHVFFHVIRHNSPTWLL